VFQAHGYHEATLRQVAEEAGVSLNAIYSSVGAKPQLLAELLGGVMEDSGREWDLASLETATSGEEVLRALANALRHVFERHEWLLSQLMKNASVDASVAETVAVGEAEYVRRLGRCVARLAEIGALRADLTQERGADVIWFYFGFPPWLRLRDCGWSWGEAEDWIIERATEALVVDGVTPRASDLAV